MQKNLSGKTQEVGQLAKRKEELSQKEALDSSRIKNLEKLLCQKEKELGKLQNNNSELANSRKDLSDECQNLRNCNSILKSEVKHLQKRVNQPEVQDELSYFTSSDINNEDTSEFERAGENKFTDGQTFRKLKPPYTSTTKKPGESTRKFLPISLIANSTGTGIIDSSDLSPNIKKSPRRNKSKSPSPKKKDKENSGQHDQKSPNRSINNTSLSPLKDTTNAAAWMSAQGCS